MYKQIDPKLIKLYRKCYLYGLMTIKEIAKRTELNEGVVSSFIRNVNHADPGYGKLLEKFKGKERWPFKLPMKPALNEPMEGLLNKYQIRIQKQAEYIKNNVCNMTYDNQFAMFISDADDSETKCLFVIESLPHKKTGYLVPTGKFSVVLALEANRKYYTKFVYELSDAIRIKEIPNHDGYWVTEDGLFLSIRRGKVLKQFKNKKGYLQIMLPNIDGSKATYRSHRLVAQAFIFNEHDKPQINHKDGVKHNNHHSNLEWCDNTENQLHAIETGLYVPRTNEEANRAKLTNEQVKALRLEYMGGGISKTDLAKKYDFSVSGMSSILSYESYKDASDPNEIPPVLTTDHNGENNARSLFTNEEVRVMRKDFHDNAGTPSALGKKYGVSSTVMTNILSYRVYKTASFPGEFKPFVVQSRS